MKTSLYIILFSLLSFNPSPQHLADQEKALTEKGEKILPSIELNAQSTSTLSASYFPNGTKISIKSDLGRYMSICRDCQKMKYSSVIYTTSFHYTGTSPRDSETFTIQNVGDKVAFKAFNGQYLALCGSCETSEGLTMVTGTSGQANNLRDICLFKLNKLSNGKFTIQSNNGRYWTRYHLKGGIKKHVAASYYPRTDRTAGHFEIESTENLEWTGADFKFLASGDPQYDDRELEDDNKAKPGTEAARADITFVRMFQKMDNNPGKYKGIIIAGDLTNTARKLELDHYKEIIKHRNKSADIYEGVGNHDYGNPSPGRIAACIVNPRSCYESAAILNFVRTKKRNTPINLSTEKDRHFISDAGILPVNWKDQETPHYSWDWNGIHFVQLNLYPGDGEGRRDTSVAKEIFYHNPLKSLRFLGNDLKKHVGNTGKPVILIHHYGFDSDVTISTGNEDYWWTAAERTAYWNAIADYNILAILTGHLHTPVKSFRHKWRKPSDAAKSNKYYEELTTFVVGGMRSGEAYTEFSVEDGKLKAVKWQGTRLVPGTSMSVEIALTPR